MTQGVILQREQEFALWGFRPFRASHGLDILTAGHGITLIRKCTLSYRVPEFDAEHQTPT